MFLERLLLLLKENSITKKQFLSDVGLGKNSFAYWEKTGAIPNQATIIGIASYFGVSVDYLLGNTEIKKGPAKSETEDGYYLLANRDGEGKGVEKLTKSEYEALMAVIKTLRQNTNEEL